MSANDYAAAFGPVSHSPDNYGRIFAGAFHKLYLLTVSTVDVDVGKLSDDMRIKLEPFLKRREDGSCFIQGCLIGRDEKCSVNFEHGPFNLTDNIDQLQCLILRHELTSNLYCIHLGNTICTRIFVKELENSEFRGANNIVCDLEDGDKPWCFSSCNTRGIDISLNWTSAPFGRTGGTVIVAHEILQAQDTFKAAVTASRKSWFFFMCILQHGKVALAHPNFTAFPMLAPFVLLGMNRTLAEMLGCYFCAGFDKVFRNEFLFSYPPLTEEEIGYSNSEVYDSDGDIDFIEL